MRAVGVVGIPHELDGELARAYVIKEENHSVLEQDIMEHVAREYCLV